MKCEQLSSTLMARRLLRKTIQGNWSEAKHILSWLTASTRRLRPQDAYIVNTEIWRAYSADRAVIGSSIPISQSSMLSSMNLRGRHAQFDVLLMTNVYSERAQCSLESEVSTYEVILSHLCEHDLHTVIKLHPRTSGEKKAILQEIAGRTGSTVIDYAITSAESFLIHCRNKDKRPIVVGPPTTALMNAQHLDLACAICTTGALFTKTETITTDITTELFRTAGVTIVESIDELLVTIHAQTV